MGIDLVTGGSGFVGAHIVRALLAAGREVRCLVRPGSNLANLRGLPVELALGDLADRSTLRESLRGVETLYHCAADYRLWARDPRELYATNVEGTRAILEEAGHAGVGRIVYTSSVGTLGLDPRGRPAQEDLPVSLADMVGHYKRSKFLAEREVETLAERGLPVVLVLPSTPVGELDVKPTPTGRLVVDFLNRRIPFYVATGLNLIDVRDVAKGHLLAAERGVIGRRYILGCRDMTLREILETLASLTHRKAPRHRLPHWIPWTVAALDTARARIFRGVPKVPLEGVKMAKKFMFFDSGRAIDELGLPQSSVEAALGRAVTWFSENGYVSRTTTREEARA